MKRFWVFVGHDYYPNTAMEDFLSDFDTLDEAKNAFSEVLEADDNSVDWGQIFDTEEKIYLHRNYPKKEWTTYSLADSLARQYYWKGE